MHCDSGSGGKLKKIIWIIAAFPLTSYASALTMPSNQLNAPGGFSVGKPYARVSMLSSHSSLENSYHTIKTVGSDESGGVSEKSVLPNRSFVSAMGALQPGKDHQVTFSVLQSMDSPETRQLTTPSGTQFTSPGTVAVARYRYSLSPQFSLSFGVTHVDTTGYSDPSLGLNFINSRDDDWSHRLDLRLSIPASERSKNDHLFTKATLRAGTTFRGESFTTSGGVSHCRPFYQDVSKVESASTSRSARTSGAALSALDLILMQKEKSRSTGSLGTSYQASKRVRLAATTSLSYVATLQSKHLWVTSAKPINAVYSRENLDIGTYVEFLSNIEKYERPSLPKFWSVGVNLSYSFGTPPQTI